jgi:uncharacterized membrane protein YfcA
MPAIVPIAIIGLVGGVLSGLFGIGGGLVIVPALILVAGFPIATAAGTSLAALLLPVGLFGALEYYRAGHSKSRRRPSSRSAFWSGPTSAPGSGRRCRQKSRSEPSASSSSSSAHA